MCSFKTIFIKFVMKTKTEIKCIYNSIYDIRNIYEIKVQERNVTKIIHLFLKLG